MTQTRCCFFWLRLSAVAGLLAGLAITATSAEVVILKDGFVIQGTPRKEMGVTTDPATGRQIPYPKDNGSEMIDEGPKWVKYSTQTRQGGDISKEVKLRPDYKAYTMQQFFHRKSNDPLPKGAVLQSTTEYDVRWNRKIRVNVPIPPDFVTMGFEFIEEQITYIDPYFTYMVSPTHLWASSYRTCEFEPAKIRKLLSTHPDFAWFKLTDQTFAALKSGSLSEVALGKLSSLKNKEFTREGMLKELSEILSPAELGKHQEAIFYHAQIVAEPAGRPDAGKRIAMAKFMLDAGWLKIAKDDLAEIRRLFPDGVPKEAKEAFEKLVKEIDAATTALLIKELELSLGAGRYRYATELKSAFSDNLTDAKQRDDATKLMAQLEATRSRYEDGRRLLRNLLDDVTGLNRAKPALAVCGGLVGAVWQGKILPTPMSALVAAGETVYSELHPDTALRIESFVNLATQAEKEKLQGRDPTKKPDELLATIISGWAMGRNGANPDPTKALKLWGAREAVLTFQRTEDLNGRNDILRNYKKNHSVDISELAQIISSLPPANPENLFSRIGTPLGESDHMPPGVYKRTTAPTADHPVGTPYYIKLPPEYHHGRAYPVLIVLSAPNFPIESILGSLAFEADRHGYILLAPDWTNRFAKGWEWKGDDHWVVTAVLRECVRNFCVDNDRVFILGVGDGANMAMDVGISHPDLFAGVLPISPIPKLKNMFNEYWTNAQALPFYIVTGQLAGASAENCAKIFERWMPRGYQSLLITYKGRGVEWYSAEVPIMFDWMGRKKRVNITGVLKLNGKGRPPWTTMRSTDNRFYWLGVEKIGSTHLLENVKDGKQILPATIQGDVDGNNVIRISSQGVIKLSVLLTSDLINWEKGVRVEINGTPATGFTRPKVLEPDVNLLLDDYRERGDRRVLLWGRLEFSTQFN